MSNPFHTKIQEIGEELGWNSDEQAEILGRTLRALVSSGKISNDDVVSAIDEEVKEEKYHLQTFSSSVRYEPK